MWNCLFCFEFPSYFKKKSDKGFRRVWAWTTCSSLKRTQATRSPLPRCQITFFQKVPLLLHDDARVKKQKKSIKNPKKSPFASATHLIVENVTYYNALLGQGQPFVCPLQIAYNWLELVLLRQAGLRLMFVCWGLRISHLVYIPLITR